MATDSKKARIPLTCPVLTHTFFADGSVIAKNNELKSLIYDIYPSRIACATVYRVLRHRIPRLEDELVADRRTKTLFVRSWPTAHAPR